MPTDPPTPLRAWRFDGSLRHYQADVLERVDVSAGRPLHIVAPPGSGKTLLGLLLAARRGRRALVLAPTTTIRGQWARAAASLAHDDDAVGEDPADLRDLTVLTYQALSVLDGENPLAGLARRRWRDEVEAEGRSPADADSWLTDLEEGNPDAYRRGIGSRSRRLRGQLSREDPDVLTAALHPNARALIDRLIGHGVETIVLDECHHLLDHWALVVAALVTRLTAAGSPPLVIGLTATLPSPDDADEYDNYTSLLGDVDYEVPVPAVVREGNLAPYRDLAWFVEPSPDELAFLRAHAEGLQVLIRTTFARGSGLEHLVATLQPVLGERSALEPPVPDEVDARLATAFAADFAAAEASAAMLATVAPQHPLVPRLPHAVHRPPTSDEALRVLARFALDRVLPDATLRPLWERIRRTLADFGYALTDRGVRRTRDPVDTMLASSLAKDFAVCDILARERSALGGVELRALVVADFAEHGNRHGGLIGQAGALRTFDVLVKDAATADLRSMVVTGSRVRIASRDADVLVPTLEALLGVAVVATPLLQEPAVAQVHAPGAGAAAFVRAAAELLTAGTLSVVVGTRGLFGEGWDCPAVHTLIDLTAVATSSATQQLRGRTLRLDPAWPEKVAHNWTVTALLPATFPVAAAPDAARLRRKHARLWGLDRSDSSRVVRGMSPVLTSDQEAALRAVVAKDGTTIAALNALLDVPSRPHTRVQWRIGQPYVDREGVSALVRRRRAAAIFRTSRPAAKALGLTLVGLVAVVVGGIAAATLAGPWVAAIAGVVLIGSGAIVGVPLWSAWRRSRVQATRSREAYRRVGEAVWAALRRADRVRAAGAMITVAEGPEHAGTVPVGIRVERASADDQRTFADALAELFGPVRVPRYLLQTGRGGRSAIVRAVLRRDGLGEHFLPVPAAIARRRGDAEAFAAAWERAVGPCVLHRLDSPAALALAARARRSGGEALVPSVIEEWV